MCRGVGGGYKRSLPMKMLVELKKKKKKNIPGARDTMHLEPLLLLPFLGVMVLVMTWGHRWYVVCPLSVEVW